jgi:HPt (histidine-containing phosphotransfer) domain-containing protein
MVSAAGMLGFLALSQLCAELESACLANRPADELLRQVRSACRTTRAEIVSLRRAA